MYRVRVTYLQIFLGQKVDQIQDLRVRHDLASIIIHISTIRIITIISLMFISSNIIGHFFFSSFAFFFPVLAQLFFLYICSL